MGRDYGRRGVWLGTWKKGRGVGAAGAALGTVARLAFCHCSNYGARLIGQQIHHTTVARNSEQRPQDQQKQKDSR